MWRENINRETLENIISSYEEILIEAQFWDNRALGASLLCQPDL